MKCSRALAQGACGETCFKRNKLGLFNTNLDPQSSSAHDEERDRELWGTWSKIVSDCFQQKTIKVFLIGPFKFAREQLNVRRAWRVSGFLPRNVEVNAPGRWATPAYS